ncbi:MAG: RNA polymerase sigma factor [Candidatus Binataceae bacterium]
MEPPESLSEFSRRYTKTIERLYRRSGGRRWSIAPHRFAEALYASYSRRLPARTGEGDDSLTISFLNALHVEDLALAIACRDGHNDAWKEFIDRFGESVRSFARAALRDSVRARELADSLWAELYGVNTAIRERQSPLAYFHGRSSLASWLRVVVARREADLWRAEQRTRAVIFDEEFAGTQDRNGSGGPDADQQRFTALLNKALVASLAQISANERLLLSYYYVQDLTLAQMSELTHQHESTVSRSLARIRGSIRRFVEDDLRRRHQLSEDEINECIGRAKEESEFDLARALSQAK